MACRNEKSANMGGVTVSKKDYDTRHEADEPGFETPFDLLIPCKDLEDPQPDDSPSPFDIKVPSPFD